ncbi:hypothetical protein GCM10017707_03390 [Paenarthrobacter aurescens]
MTEASPSSPTGTSLDDWWVRDNLRETIDLLVELGYTISGGQGEDPDLIDPGDQQWRPGTRITPTSSE